MDNIDFAGIEKKWQDKWEKERVFETHESEVGEARSKFYVLEMFPYPSGTGLHMGHALNYTIGDILARFKRMKGFEVLHPMGFDALGLPAENAAIKAGEHPQKYTDDAIENYIRQQKAMGFSYDWSRMVNSTSPDYYKWDQWIFLKMLEKGLAYQKEAAVNWCSECNSVLANEQVNEGRCWRHEETEVEVRKLRQWFFRTTKYADELLDGLDGLDWPERTKAMQRNWIGRSEGTEIEFSIENSRVAGDGKRVTGDLGNVVIVHGSPVKDKTKDEDYIPDNEKAWIGWIKKKLDKIGISCNCPQMPIPWKPKYEEWKREFEKININGDSILIGTSAGGGFLVRWLGETKTRIRKLILVSPGMVGMSDRLNEFYGEKFYEDVKDLVKEKIIIYTSEDDLNYHITGAKKYAKVFDGKFMKFGKGYGHFTSKTLVGKDFPELLDEILTTDYTDEHGQKDAWKVFTTRPDTIFGVTFMVVAAGHDRLDELVTDDQRSEVDEFLKKIKSVSEKDVSKLDKEGVFSGSYMINPANDERVPIWIGNFVLADYGSGMVMAVPAHDVRDFEFAQKYGIEVRQVVAPFIRKNVDENKETKERCTVFGIVKNPKDGKILCLDWKKTGWKAFPAGGVDEGEDVVDAVAREIREETGYKNLKFVRKIGGELYQNFYRPHKGDNVYCKNEAYYFELIDEERDEVDAKELEKHEAVWIDEGKVKDFVNVFGPEIVWDWYLNGDTAFVGEGVLCNSGDFDKTKRMLKTLGKLKILSEKEKINFWILGGLAGAFYAGKIYREHGDLDLIVKNVGDHERFCKLLEETGFSQTAEKKLTENLTNKTYENSEGIEVDIGPNVGEFGLIDKDFEKDEMELEGIGCKVLSKRFLVRFKEYLIKNRDKEKDGLDLDVLNGKVVVGATNFNGMGNVEAKGQITDWLIEKGVGKRVVNFKLRDWGVSRQRYWGTPIPIIYCEDCGAVPVLEKDLPIVLPKNVKFGEGNPLEGAKEWLSVECPKCGGKGRRESDTMDTFVNSSWYFLRYCDPNNSEKIFDSNKVKFWNPIDVYVGGAEHACMHLLYARFYVKFLRDLGLLDFDEPFIKLFHQGMLHAEDGRKMSKSLGNVVEPIETMKKFGVDATRWFLISVASPDKDFDWSEKGIMGATRFIKKVCNFYDEQVADGRWQVAGDESKELVSKLNLTIKNVGEYYENFGYRKATIEIRELFGLMSSKDDPAGPDSGCSKETAEKFLKLIAPICPHIAEELWEKLSESRVQSPESRAERKGAGEGSGFISVATWPEFDEGGILKSGDIGDLNSRIIERVKKIISSNDNSSKLKNINKVYVYVMPFEIGNVDAEVLSEGIGKEVVVFAVNDSEKIDPEGRAKKAKPGLAAIYLE